MPPRPLPSFAQVLQFAAEDKAQGTLSFSKKDFTDLLRAILLTVNFDENSYGARNLSLIESKRLGHIDDLRRHWVWNGYFEGRFVFGWEDIPFDIERELLQAPNAYFELLHNALTLMFDERYREAEAAFLEGESAHRFPLGARIALANMYFQIKRPLDCYRVLEAAGSMRCDSERLSELKSQVFDVFEQIDLAIDYAARVPRRNFTLEQADRLFRIGRLSEAKRLLSEPRGDRIFRENLSGRVDAELARVRARARIILKARRDEATATEFDAAELTLNLAKLGRHRLATKLAKVQLLGLAHSYVADGERDILVELLCTALRIAEGVSTASYEANACFKSTTNRSAVQAQLAARLSYQNDDCAGTIALLSGFSHQEIEPQALQALAYAFHKQGRFEEALGICRELWPQAKIQRWIVSMVLTTRRAQDIYSGLSDGLDYTESVQGVSSIPRRIMQFWDRETPPADVQFAMSTFRKNHPNFEYVRFDDRSARDFMRDRLGNDGTAAYDYCYHPAMKADLFRLAYLYKEGGIYVDADEQSGLAFDRILDRYPDKTCFFTLSDQQIYVNNRFIAAEKDNDWIASILRNVVSAILEAQAHNSRPSIWDITGPNQLSYVIAERLLQEDDAALRSEVGQFGFLYYQTLNRFAQVGRFDYKATDAGNWRSGVWAV